MKKNALPVLLMLTQAVVFHSIQAQPTIVTNDSVTVAASAKYNQASFVRRLVMGTNYRKEWATPVKVPVFHLVHSGFIIEKLGGGMQTKSLHLLDQNNREWALRMVDKHAAGAIPWFLRNTFIQSIVQDMISAAHPYAALTVGYLAKAGGVVAAQPTLYFVPNDPAFGQYQSLFANTLCFLEQSEPTPDQSETQKTNKVLEKITEENDHLILQQTVLKARLLDMLIADWDRHSDQWEWGSLEAGKTKYYYVIPKDRDQAFFMANGWLPKFARLTAMPYISRFTKECTGLKSLNYKSRHFDPVFLNELDWPAWEKITMNFQQQLTDSVIIAAVHKLPAAIYRQDSAAIVQTLISRRNSLLPNLRLYYNYLAGYVKINGSDENELFKISANGNDLTVAIYRYKKDNTLGRKIYERTFNQNETKIIYLNALAGQDSFIIDKAVASKIKLKIRGGTGKDIYDIKGNIKTVIHDK